MKKRAFTLIETLIVIFVVSVGLIVIIQGMASSHRYISETAQRTIALNLAKEGIEAVYNLRNTNRRRFSDKKDQCWITNLPYSYSPSDCQNYPWLKAGQLYIIDDILSPSGTISNDGLVRIDEIDEIALDSRDHKYGWFANMSTKPYEQEAYRLYPYSGQWIRLDAIPENQKQQAKQNLQQGVYYRVISIHSLHNKENGGTLNNSCTHGTASAGISGKSCGDDFAKEIRFCSTVFYTQPYQGVVNICSIITNFQK